MRYYVYAAPLPDGQWQLRSSFAIKDLLHPNEDAALIAARLNCRRIWEETGNPCGVRVQRSLDQWEDHFLVGDHED